MGNISKHIVITGLLMGLVAIGTANAVVIQLKSGGRFEGTIVSEDEKQIVLNMGAGTITIQKSDIAPAAAPRTEKRIFVLTEQTTPPEFRNLLRSLRDLEEQRLTAGQTHQRLLGLQKKSEQDDKRLLQLLNQQLEITKELGHSPGGNNNAIKAYNNRVAQLNGIRADILELDKTTKQTHTNLDQCRRDLSGYITTLLMFADQVKQRKQASPGAADPATVSNFFAAVDSQLRYYLAETRQVQVPCQRNSRSAQVVAKLNGTIPGRFVVDTGCTGMTISKELANQLHVKPLERETTATLADGSTIQCQVALLDSVEVEGLRVKNIPVMIMPRKPTDETDGLLGMGFLMGFNIQLDHTAKTVTLIEFAPR